MIDNPDLTVEQINKKLIAGLEFYADKDNWQSCKHPGHKEQIAFIAQKDKSYCHIAGDNVSGFGINAGGKKARQLLKEITNG